MASYVSILPHYRCQSCGLVLCGEGEAITPCRHPLAHITKPLPGGEMYPEFARQIIAGPMCRGLL